MKEVWKPVADLEDKYLVSNLGRFFSKYLKRIMKQATDKDGYKLITLNNKTRRAHRVIAETFIPNPDNLQQINHKDGNKENNVIDNLEWCDSFYNMQHRYRVLKQKPYNFGLKMSEEQKLKLSIIKKGKNTLGDNARARRVLCIETGKEYSCAREAEIEIGVSKGCVAHCAKGYVKTSGGYHWQYV